MSKEKKTISTFDRTITANSNSSYISNDTLIPADLSTLGAEIGPKFPDLKWVEGIYKVHILAAKCSEYVDGLNLKISENDLEFIVEQYMHFIDSK